MVVMLDRGIYSEKLSKDIRMWKRHPVRVWQTWTVSTLAVGIIEIIEEQRNNFLKQIPKLARLF